MDLQALGNDLADREARAERALGILEDDLHGAAQRPQVLVAEALDGLAVEADGALGRQQAKEGEAEGGLAGAALAHDADGVALAHGNRYAVDGAHMIDGALQHAFLDREPDFHVVTLHDHRRIGRATDRATLGFGGQKARSEEHTSELQSLMRISYAVF